MPWTQAQQWEAISRLSEISHSFTSTLQRQLAGQFEKMNALGLANIEQPQSVTVTPLIEADTGRLASYKA